MSHVARLTHRSIFLKLLIILTITGILIDAVVFSGMHLLLTFAQRPRGVVSKNLEHYAEYLSQDLGAPPSFVRAQALANDLSLGIRYEGPHGDWTTSNDVPTVHELEGLATKTPGPVQSGRYHHHRVVVVPRKLPEEGKLVILVPAWTPLEPHTLRLVILTLIVSLLVATSYLFIRGLLKPVHWLTEAVQAFGQGNLDQQVPVRHADELGLLAESFNQMAARIKQMIRAREQLLLDVSHELRSPLTRAKLVLELMPEDRRKDQLSGELADMEHMIHELLESARMDSGYGGLHLGSTDLARLVSEVGEKYTAASPGVRLDLQVPQLLAIIDEQRIRTVLVNLVENALKYSQGKAPVELTLRAHADTAVIQVSDHGVGIPSDEIEKVFQPFYRVDKSRARGTGGFGLGLSLCRKIITAHGGKIRLSSSPEKGTVAEVTLPLGGHASPRSRE